MKLFSKLKVLGLLLLLIFSCKKEEITPNSDFLQQQEVQTPQTNTQHDFYTFKSSLLKNLVHQTNVTFREDEYLEDENMIERIRETLREMDNERPFMDDFAERYGYAIWDKILQYKLDGEVEGKVFFIPMGKPNSTQTEAVLPLLLRNNELILQKVIPRFEVPQLIEGFIDAAYVSSATILTKFDMELFQNGNILYYIISKFDRELIEFRDNCWWAFVDITYYTDASELQMIDQGGDGGWYWGHLTQQTTVSVITWVCEGSGDFLGNTFPGFNPYDDYNPEPGTGHPNSGEHFDYISDLEHENAQVWHGIFNEFNPDYGDLNDIFDDCSSENWKLARRVGTQLISEIIGLQNQAENINENELINLLSDISQRNLKDFIENAIEILADNGVYLSFTGAIKDAAELAHKYSNIMQQLCSLNSSDTGYLVWDRTAFSQMIDYLEEGNTISSFEIIDNKVFVLDEEGILHVFIEPIDLETASKAEVLTQILTVLNAVNSYECASTDYEPIDWRDYFDNIETISISDANWQSPTGTICSLAANLDFDMQPRYIMETFSAWQGSNTDDTYFFKWNRINTNIPMLQITVPNDCLQIFEEYIFDNC